MKAILRKILGRLPSLRPASLWHILCELNHCPVELPWFGFGGDDPISRCHRLGAELEWPRTIVSVLLFAVFWPCLALILTIRSVNRDGQPIRRLCGIGLGRQFRQLLYLSLRHNITPQAYYRCRLWEPAALAKAAAYLQNHEVQALMRYLGRDVDLRYLHEKGEFYAAAIARGIPTIPVCVVFSRDGLERWYQADRQLPAQDLFIKRADLWCGEGAGKWCWRENERRWANGQDLLDEAEFLAFCRRTARRDGAMVVQPAVSNHPALASFSGGGLCTVRVVTYNIPQIGSGVLSASLRMPIAGSLVDNFSAGGIAAAIDPSGRLQAPTAKDVSAGVFTHHPDTGEELAGKPMPFHREILACAEAAQACFAEPWIVGWDVAVTPDGPVVVEGNQLWGVDIIQIPYRKPMGEMGFPELLLAAAEAKQQQLAERASKTETNVRLLEERSPRPRG